MQCFSHVRIETRTIREHWLQVTSIDGTSYPGELQTGAYCGFLREGIRMKASGCWPLSRWAWVEEKEKRVEKWGNFGSNTIPIPSTTTTDSHDVR